MVQLAVVTRSATFSQSTSICTNSSDLVINTTPSSAQVFSFLDGVALGVFMQYGMIPYVAVCKDRDIRYKVAGPGKPMVSTLLPSNYKRKSWLDVLRGVEGD